MHIFIISFTVCAALILTLHSIAHHVGMVDHPDERKHHQHPTPTVGGVAMFIGVLTAFLMFGKVTPSQLIVLWCAAGLVILGLLDDKHNLSVRIRIVVQVLVALIVIHDADGMINNLGVVFGFHLSLGILALPFSLLAYIFAVNAMNMIDGSDGMAGSMALITIVGAVVAFCMTNTAISDHLALAVIGALCGFLLFNARIFVKRAWIFMGDAGSMWLGLVVAWLLARISKSDVDPWVSLWLFGLPLIDTFAVIFRRMSRKKSPFKADRTHIHHIFERHGHSTSQSVLLAACAQAILVATGILLIWISAPTIVVLGGFIIVFSVYYYVLRHQHL